MQSGSLKFLYNLFTAEIRFKKIYYFLLAKLTGLKAYPREHAFNKFRIKIRDSASLSYKQAVIREFNPLYVLVREKKITYQVNFNENPEHFKILLPNIQTMQPVHTMIKWKTSNFSIYTIYRNYPLKLAANLKSFTGRDVALNTAPRVNKVDNDKIELERRLRVTEEIITIRPYIRPVSRKKLYDIPVTKKPLYKSYFHEDEMIELREALAKQNKTRRSNVEISQIYDKFNIDIFSSVKHDSNTKNLTCYLNNKPVRFNEEKTYLLIIGNRRDNKIPIKALARLEKR